MLWKKQPVGSKIADLQTNKASKDAATQSAAGLMSAADKTKLDGIDTGATAVSVIDSLDSDSATSALSAAQGKTLNSNINSVKSLWVNPNTNSSFAAQQVSLNEAVTNYQFVYIEFRSKTTSSAYTSIFVPSITLSAMLVGYSFYGGSVTSRTVKAVNNGTVMEFADASNTHVDNTLVIPSRIIGYIKI